MKAQTCRHEHASTLLPVFAINTIFLFTLRVGQLSSPAFAMAFTMRQPFRLTSTLGYVSKSAFKSTPIRAFHHSRPAADFFTSRATTPISTLAKARNAFRQSRTYMQQTSSPTATAGNLGQKLLIGGAMFGGTLIALNVVC